MYIKLKELLLKKGKTRYWLAANAEISPPTIHKIYYQQTSSISFEVLEKICVALDCTPNDLLQIEPQKVQPK